ncbi:uncharacterized protein LOC118435724 [Folsomia candida]|uniref:uncharacterized protein LOC118435724 n=1 Tax=Folsomia candida TaxID=158441 RepID=UPI001604C0E6|nr:uncharacterized protein LOC118435724 [Folsomia candida]
MARTCFGRLTVGHGTLIIGILHIVCAILSVILISIGIFQLMAMEDPDPIKEPNFREDASFYITIGCIQIFIAVVYLILASLMVHGYRIRNYRFIMPWLVWNYVSLCLGAAATFITFLRITSAYASTGQGGAGFIIVAVSVLSLAVGAYFVSVVARFVDGLKVGSN